MASAAPCLILASSGERVPLVEGLTVGRAPSSGWLLEDPSVSGRHAAFRRAGDRWMIQDLGSTNGTFLNEVRIQDQAWLAEGDSIRFGTVSLRVEGLATPAPLRPPLLMAPAPSLAGPPPLPKAVAPPSLPPPLPVAPPPLAPARATPNRQSHGLRWTLVLGGAGVLLLATFAAWAFLGRTGGQLRGPIAFRESARKAPPAAFQKALAPGMQARLGQLNEVLWPTADAPVGWAWFFSTSVVAAAPEHKGRKPVLFYNPWADMGLITLWKGQETIAGLEMVPGKVLREGGAPPYGGTLAWARQEAYGPIGVSYVSAQTIHAFEKAFAQDSSLDAAIPALGQPQGPTAMRVACGLQMAQVVRSLVAFSQPANNPTRVAFIRLLAEGKVAVDRAIGTPPEVAQALKALPEEAWAGFMPTVMVDTGDKVLVLAHNRGNPDLFLGVVFLREGGGLVPGRLDLMSFNACYRGLR